MLTPLVPLLLLISPPTCSSRSVSGLAAECSTYTAVYLPASQRRPPAQKALARLSQSSFVVPCILATRRPIDGLRSECCCPALAASLSIHSSGLTAALLRAHSADAFVALALRACASKPRCCGAHGQRRC
ncbi:hypothetical protein BJY59DRAFT_545715 [Rhodotorula toruloides]